ncbi:hypothetical protein BTVI_138239 [Pitangus sulphuratus]|nr:hypothetical protein BTVI_138239 [Pitangus sulphuratus]
MPALELISRPGVLFARAQIGKQEEIQSHRAQYVVGNISLDRGVSQTHSIVLAINTYTDNLWKELQVSRYHWSTHLNHLNLMAKQIKTNEAIRVTLTYKEYGRASGGGFVARLGTCSRQIGLTSKQPWREREQMNEIAGVIQYQIWDVAGQGSLLPPGAFDNGKLGGSSRFGFEWMERIWHIGDSCPSSRHESLDLCWRTGLVLQQRLQAEGHLTNSCADGYPAMKPRKQGEWDLKPDASSHFHVFAYGEDAEHSCWPRSPLGGRLLEEPNLMGR